MFPSAVPDQYLVELLTQKELFLYTATWAVHVGGGTVTVAS
jgi:hypothetical protein